MKVLRDFHDVWGYLAIIANAVAGVVALVAWQARRLRGRGVWIVTIAAECMMLLEVLTGGILSANDYEVDDFHVFYGVLAFLTVGIAYQYRTSMRGRTELLYGLVGLFIMGLGIRAVTA